jgi:hypothetical protein
MPLAFQSLNRGTVAFGFFHIETDLVLLERRVFWCRQLCELFSDLAATGPDREMWARLPGWEPAELGDLHGAIAGVSHAGLIGELYRRWPFPADPAGFRQKAAGAADRGEVAALLDRHGRRAEWEVIARRKGARLELDGTAFDPPGAKALAVYLWRGGMPGWQEGRRPDYLWEAAEAWRAAANPLLAGLELRPGELGFR